MVVDAFLEQHREDLVELVADLVSIDSQIPPHADERRIVEFLRNRMAAMGLDQSEVIRADPSRPESPDAYRRDWWRKHARAERPRRYEAGGRFVAALGIEPAQS